MSNEFYKLKVKEVVKETPDAVTIFFYHPDEGKIEYKPGQFLTVQIQSEGEKIRRAYSLCTSPYIDEYLGVTVKRVSGGKISNYLNQAVKPGDILEIMKPLGNFTIDNNIDAERHLIFLGGGSGITPLISIIKTTLLLEPKTIVSLVYANRDSNSIIFKKELDGLKEKYKKNFNLIYSLDHAPFLWRGISGLLNADKIKSILKKLPQGKNTEYFICGPEVLMDIYYNTLVSLSIPKENIHKESFESKTVIKASNKTEEELKEEGIVTREVKVIYDGEEYNFIVPPEKSILDAALDLDLDLPYSCQSGLCTACRGKCISGQVKMVEDEGLSEREKKEGYVLICVGHPVSNDVVIEIG